MNAHEQNLSLLATNFGGCFIEDAGIAAVDSMLRAAVDRIARAITRLLTCMRNVLGGDWKYRAGDLDEPRHRFGYCESRRHFPPGNKLKAIPNLITTINHRLWTEMAPMTAV